MISDKKREEILAKIRTKTLEITKTKETARAFLLSTGIYNSDGSLHKNYGGEIEKEK